MVSGRIGSVSDEVGVLGTDEGSGECSWDGILSLNAI